MLSGLLFSVLQSFMFEWFIRSSLYRVLDCSSLCGRRGRSLDVIVVTLWLLWEGHPLAAHCIAYHRWSLSSPGSLAAAPDSPTHRSYPLSRSSSACVHIHDVSGCSVRCSFGFQHVTRSDFAVIVLAPWLAVLHHRNDGGLVDARMAC